MSFLSQSPDAQVIDVRKPAEWQREFVKGAMTLDVDDKNNFIESLKLFNPNKHYYVFSKTGKRGEIACKIMDELGFKETVNLRGGIIDCLFNGL